MLFTIIIVLLSLAIAKMAIATKLVDDVPCATVTVTVTEPVCMNGCAAETTPLSVANALATAADSSAASSLISSMMADAHRGDVGAYQPAVNTTTVTTVTSATNCPAPPTFDLPAIVSSVFDSNLNSITANNTVANGTEAPDKRWSEGRQSLCFTSSSLVFGGYHAIFLDGWGRDKDGCGRGALDNLRGQCFDVSNWECRFWGPRGVLLTFYLTAPPRVKCALDAMWLASPKDAKEEGLCCVYLGSPVGTANTC
ncbi:hypothetical protein N8I77_011546 [Diaporthe amygdali]|uniref:Uncharacterized protein n=1 Tax=Phomopsis amygdali TaxID=1214568 RepID=A0AAD9VYK1_PHOAM|nr:hypothetical protein N8I77_011546 [Diaporthe amygdali]